MKVIKYIKRILYKLKMYDFLSNQFGKCVEEKEFIYEQIKGLNLENDRLHQRNIELASQVQRYKLRRPSVHSTKAWNDRWQKSTIFYKAPIRQEVIDYVRYRDVTIISSIAVVVIAKHSLSCSDVDAVPLAVMRWLDDKFKEKQFRYKADNKEVWSSPEELLDRKVGDCDDYGILEYFIIREIFKKLGCWKRVKHRLKCMCGNVNRYSLIPSGAGGHFYLNWLHGDGEWHTVESTYFRSKAIAYFGNKPQKFNPAYGTIWFGFNEEYSWAQNSLTVVKDDFRKVF